MIEQKGGVDRPMTSDPSPIPVTDATTLTEVLDEAAGTPVRLERSGVVYRLSREDADIWAGYDPERVRAGLRRVAGLITPEEATRMKELVYRGREEGTRPIDRP
jgi:hypothetical protein